MYTTKQSKQALAALSLIALAACGGGGGDGGNEPISSQTSGVSGVASKGLILNGLATAYAVNSDGSKGAALQTVRTNKDDGSYSFTGLPKGVAILLEVTGVPGETTMKDEATATTLPLDASFKLRAATVTGDSGNVAVQITPYSEMAVALAVASSGGLSADNVQKANQKVVGFAGEDVLSIPPTFDSTGKPTNPAAVKLAAVSELANTGGLGCTGTPLAKVKCVVDEMAKKGPSDDALATAVGTATETVKDDVSLELSAKVQPVTTQLPGLPSGPVLSAVGSAKALVTSFRNLGTSLDNKDTGSISSRLKRLDTDLSSLPGVLPSSLMDEIDMVSRALALFNKLPPSAGRAGNDVPLGYDTRCHYTNATTLDCRSTQVFVSYNPSSGAWSYVQYRAQLTAGATGNTNIITSLVTQEGDWGMDGFESNWDSAATTVPGAGPFAAVGRGDGDGTLFNGDLAPGISYYDAAPQGAKASVSLTVALTAGATTERYAVTGFVKQFKVAGDSTPYAATEVLSGSYFEEQIAAPSNTTKAHLDVVSTLNTANGGVKVTGLIDTSKYKPRAKNNIPGKATFTGTIVDLSGNTKLFEGSVTGDNLIDANGDSAKTGRTGALSLTLYMPNLSRNITLNVNAITETAVGQYSFSGSFVDGSTLVTFVGDDKVGEANDFVNFTSNGVNFNITPASLNALTPLKNGSGVVIGQYDDKKSQITYADGSYERF